MMDGMNADRDDASELTMDGKGRVTIPMALRKSAGIAAGTPLNI